MDLYLDGEKVVKVVPHVGYLHRAVEKPLRDLAYVQITPSSTRTTTSRR
jgi:NADH:ubiquinone oxidoreductase subunit D